MRKYTWRHLLAVAAGMALLLCVCVVTTFVVSTGAVSFSPWDILPISGPEVEIAFWASEEVVPRGGCTVLHWEVHGAEDYPALLNGEEVPAFGEEEVCLEGPMTFELIVEAPGGPFVRMVFIEVEDEGPPVEGGPEVIILVAEPDAIHPGECAMLHWEVHPEGDWRILLGGEAVPHVGERDVCPESTTTYELLVEAAGGPRVQTVTLRVEPWPGPESTPPPEPTPPPPPTPAPEPTPPPAPTTAPPPTTAPAPPPTTAPAPPPTATTAPSQPSPTTPSGADVRPSDLYPDNQPQGNIWVRVVNDGPATLTNKKVRIGGSYTRSTLTTPPSASGANIPAVEYTINLAPGQQQNINLGWQIDLTQYNYQFTATVTAVDFTDPNTGNNSYTESFQAPPTPVPQSDITPTDCFLDSPKGTLWYRVNNRGPAALTNKRITVSITAEAHMYNPPHTITSATATGIQTVSIPVGQDLTINSGISVDNTTYWYKFTVTVSAMDFADPNANNNSYSETIPPPP